MTRPSEEALNHRDTEKDWRAFVGGKVKRPTLELPK